MWHSVTHSYDQFEYQFFQTSLAFFKHMAISHILFSWSIVTQILFLIMLQIINTLSHAQSELTQLKNNCSLFKVKEWLQALTYLGIRGKPNRSHSTAKAICQSQGACSACQSCSICLYCRRPCHQSQDQVTPTCFLLPKSK